MFEGAKPGFPFRTKSLGEILGERVLAPLISKVSSLISLFKYSTSCGTGNAIGSFASVLSKNPLPLLITSITCSTAEKVQTKEYGIFFDLDTIKIFPSKYILLLKEFLKNRDRDSFDNILENVGGKDIEHRITKELAEKQLYYNDKLIYDFHGLVGELFNNFSEFEDSENTVEVVDENSYMEKYRSLIKPVFEITSFFSDANQFIERIKEKDLILFIGGTGAGKSTSINFLLGRKLFLRRNKFGQKVYDTADPDNPHYPKIGHSPAESQTTCVQGYSMKGEENLVLADSPGFYETREYYKPLQAYYFDETMRQVRSIRAVVLTIPYKTFELDRGNKLIDLIQLLSQLIPNIYQNNSTYILVTKHFSSQDVHLKSLIKEYCNDKTEQETRKQVLKFVCLLDKKGKVRRVDVGNDIRAESLLQQYKNSKALNATLDFTPLLSDKQTETLIKDMEPVFPTWINLFNDYLKTAHRVNYFLRKKSKGNNGFPYLKKKLEVLETILKENWDSLKGLNSFASIHRFQPLTNISLQYQIKFKQLMQVRYVTE